MSTIQVEIVSAEGHIFSGEATMLIAPAKMGDVGVTPRHAPLLTDLRPGEVRIQTPDHVERSSRHWQHGLLSARLGDQRAIFPCESCFDRDQAL